VALAPGANFISSPLNVTGLTGTMVGTRFHIVLTTPDDSKVSAIDPSLPIPGTPGHVAIYSQFQQGALSGANMGTGCGVAQSTTWRVDATNDTWKFEIIFTGTNPTVTATLNCWSVDAITSP
jgi:hypothetical protein